MGHCLAAEEQHLSNERCPDAMSARLEVVDPAGNLSLQFQMDTGTPTALPCRLRTG